MRNTWTIFLAAVSLLLPNYALALTVVQFTSTGTTSWTVPTGIFSTDYLVVGGGGGGGYGLDRTAGGGGAGGVRTGTLSVTPGQSLTVTVGAGGTGGSSGAAATAGGNSVFGSITSTGGGRGGASGNLAGSGGSGGGRHHNASDSAGAGTAGQGNNGGPNGYDSGVEGGIFAASGGGGAGAVGSSGTVSGGGAGGAGIASSITGSSVTYGGGGGGGGQQISGGAGGAGGGGAGGTTGTAGTNGTANTGGGGGGGSRQGNSTGPAGANGGNGGSGIVIISYVPFDGITINDSVTINGDLNITGALAKSSGSFVIDHPLDPKNKLLYHSFVESPDAKNVYVGRATLDDQGETSVALPRYFLALNTDVRYFATPVGVAMQDLHLSVGVRPRFFGLFGTPEFRISGGVPGGEVSWMVTGIRHDPYILANPITPVVKKSASAPYAQGMYVHPQLFAPSTPQK